MCIGVTKVIHNNLCYTTIVLFYHFHYEMDYPNRPAQQINYLYRSKLREDPGEEQSAPRDQEQSAPKEEEKEKKEEKEEEREHHLPNPSQQPVLDVYYELNPATSALDLLLRVTTQPIDIVYNEDIIDRWVIV